MAIKTYVLLEHTESTAPIYQRINQNERVQLKKRRFDAPYMRMTFQSKEGKSRTIRFKLGAESIYQDEQIKAGLLANEPFTDQERVALRFVNGVLITPNINVQNFLDSHPQNESFWKPDEEGRQGYCSEILQPLFRLFEKEKNLRVENLAFRKRLNAANIIAGITSLDEGQSLLIKLYGTFYQPPTTLDEVTQALIAFLDDADDAGLDKILATANTADEEASILVGKLLSTGLLSFVAKDNAVCKKKGDKWVVVKEISSSYPEEERKNYFLNYLTSQDGKLLYDDLKAELKAELEKPQNKQGQKKQPIIVGEIK